MDYDKIVEGRRRNWDALKPDEQREIEREEAREKRRAELEEKEKQGGRTPAALDRLRRTRQDPESELDRERFRQTVRLSGLLVGGFIAALILFTIAGKVLEQRRYRAFQAEVHSMERIVVAGEGVHDLSEPIKALATWRTLWRDGDMKGLVDMFSPYYLDRLTKRKTKAQITGEYVRLFAGGNLTTNQAIAAEFDNPEVIRIPHKPWTEGELALFRSDFITLVTDDPPGHRYIVALVWDSKDSEWRFAEMREAEFFSIKWERETFIQQKQVGGMAVRYDDNGNEIRQKKSE